MSILRSSRHSIALGIAFISYAHVLAGQTTQQPVPPELVTALFAGGNYASVSSRYVVGALPPGWPAELVPAPPVIVSGGMLTGDRRYAVFVDSSARHPVDALRRQLETAGWTRPPTEPAQGFNVGFQEDDGRYGFWCRDSVRATLASTRGVDSTTFVRVGLETLHGNPCVPRRQRDMMEHPTLRLPVLLPPPGIHSVGGGGGSGGNAMNANTRLVDSTTSAAAMLAHYGAQLVKAGWTVHPPTANAAFGSQALEARDRNGAPWYGMMIVIPSASTREVSIMMSRTSTR